MENKTFKQLEEKAVELFGEKGTVTVATIRVGNNGYIVRIKMQGMPFEISSFKKSLEEAEELALAEFYKQVEMAVKDTLFTTQPLDKYKERKLTDEEFSKLFKFEEMLGDEYTEELKNETSAKICKLENGKYECVVESPYMQLHARATSGSEAWAVNLAIWNAHDVFNANRISVGDKF